MFVLRSNSRLDLRSRCRSGYIRAAAACGGCLRAAFGARLRGSVRAFLPFSSGAAGGRRLAALCRAALRAMTGRALRQLSRAKVANCVVYACLAPNTFGSSEFFNRSFRVGPLRAVGPSNLRADAPDVPHAGSLATYTRPSPGSRAPMSSCNLQRESCHTRGQHNCTLQRRCRSSETALKNIHANGHQLWLAVVEELTASSSKP